MAVSLAQRLCTLPRMKLRLLRFFVRRPLTLLALGVATLAGGAAAIGFAATRPHDEPQVNEPQEIDPQADPRALIGRVWFDSYPRKATDNIKIFIFFGSGFGLYEEGSAYRASIDFFEFERQGDSVWIKFKQDGKTAQSKFKIQGCDEKSPFDLCLDMPDTPRGPKRFYGFGYDDDFANRVPWGPQMKRALEEYSRVH